MLVFCENKPCMHAQMRVSHHYVVPWPWPAQTRLLPCTDVHLAKAAPVERVHVFRYAFALEELFTLLLRESIHCVLHVVRQFLIRPCKAHSTGFKQGVTYSISQSFGAQGEIACTRTMGAAYLMMRTRWRDAKLTCGGLRGG